MHHLLDLVFIGKDVGDIADIPRDRRQHGGIHSQIAVALELLSKRNDVGDFHIGRNALRRRLHHAWQLGYRQREDLVRQCLDELSLVGRARKVAINIGTATSEHQRLGSVKVLLALLDDDGVGS